MELLSLEPRWLAGQESLLSAPTSYHTPAPKASQDKPGLEGSHPKTTRHTSIQRPFHSTVIILISRPALKSILLSSRLIPNAGLVGTVESQHKGNQDRPACPTTTVVEEGWELLPGKPPNVIPLNYRPSFSPPSTQHLWQSLWCTVTAGLGNQTRQGVSNLSRES